MKCENCKEEKEIGKELFFCPRIRQMFKGEGMCGGFYGNFICKDCCKNNFLDNIHRWHQSGSAFGHCRECDFPVGAIIWANNESFVLESHDYAIVDKNIGRDKVGKDYTVVDAKLSSFQYYNFKWKHPNLKLQQLTVGEGVEWLVLINEKLPTRIILTPEDIVTLPPFNWYDLRRYYWASNGKEQHFDKEEWMDKAPVVLSNNYANLDNNSLEQSKSLKEKLKYLLNYVLECKNNMSKEVKSYVNR